VVRARKAKADVLVLLLVSLLGLTSSSAPAPGRELGADAGRSAVSIAAVLAR
jgi:hypothetical protein